VDREGLFFGLSWERVEEELRESGGNVRGVGFSRERLMGPGEANCRRT
jgi:hypothetical protein